jgi:hypothetical protein
MKPATSGGKTAWIYNKGGIEPLKSFLAYAGQLKRGGETWLDLIRWWARAALNHLN